MSNPFPSPFPAPCGQICCLSWIVCRSLPRRRSPFSIACLPKIQRPIQDESLPRLGVHVARLHADPAFRADLKAAKAEVAALRARGSNPTRDCKAEAEALAYQPQPFTGEVEILQAWQGDFPVAQLSALPEDQRDQGIGYIADARAFENIWKALKPEEAVPEIDFKENLVLFARNTEFFNRIRIGKVDVKDGVAEVLAAETMSAMPIEDKVAMSLAVVPRRGIASIQSSGVVRPIEQ